MVAQELVGATPEIAELHAAARYHGDLWTIHWRVCPARKAGLDCLKCHQLESVADAADDRLDAALEAVS